MVEASQVEAQIMVEVRAQRVAVKWPHNRVVKDQVVPIAPFVTYRLSWGTVSYYAVNTTF